MPQCTKKDCNASISQLRILRYIYKYDVDIICLKCLNTWRTRAKYAYRLARISETERNEIKQLRQTPANRLGKFLD